MTGSAKRLRSRGGVLPLRGWLMLPLLTVGLRALPLLLLMLPLLPAVRLRLLLLLLNPP